MKEFSSGNVARFECIDKQATKDKANSVFHSVIHCKNECKDSKKNDDKWYGVFAGWGGYC